MAVATSGKNAPTAGEGFFSPGENDSHDNVAPCDDAGFSSMSDAPGKKAHKGGKVAFEKVNKFAGNDLEGPFDALALCVAGWISSVGWVVASLGNSLRRMWPSSPGKDNNEKWHRNIKMMLVFRLFNGIAFAARAGGIFDGYIYGLFGDNKTVGLIGTLNGVASVSSAPIVGFLSDYYRHKRSKLLKVCAVCAVICLVTHSYAVSSKSLPLLLLSTFCWRAWYEFVFVISEALFADSVPQGRRSEFFTKRRVVTTLSNSAGPLVTASMLYWLKNADGTFSLRVMESLLHFSLFLVVPQVIALWFWKDVEKEEKPTRQPALPKPESECTTQSVSTSGDAEECVEIAPLVNKDNKDDKAKTEQAAIPQALEQSAAVVANDEDSFQLPDRRFMCFGPRSVPWIILLSHVVQFAGAGMTVKFFPLFFKTEYGFQPIQGCILASVYTLFITGFTIVIQRFSKTIGRPQASVIFTILGIFALLVLSRAYSLPLVLAMYILRGSLQNASAPIDRSMQMDYVPAAHRGKWTALESLLTMAWAFSALFGGFIADMKDYRFTFQITAAVFVISTIMYLPLLWLVPRDESFAAETKKKRS